MAEDNFRHPRTEMTLTPACFTMKVHDFKSVEGTLILQPNLQS